MFTLPFWHIGIWVILLAFLAEYMDATLGMGYGTSLTPLLISIPIFGFAPLQVVPAILLSELVVGTFAGLFHNAVGNVRLFGDTMKFKPLTAAIEEKGFFAGLRHSMPTHLKMVVLIASLSAVGAVAAALIAINIPEFWLRLYIGVLILGIGVYILATLGKTFKFTWGKLMGLGALASFNKGMSGGGYGPVVTGGQLLSGVDAKASIAVTSMAEGFTCFFGLITYIAAAPHIDLSLAPYLLIGGALSVPLSALSVKRMRTKRLRLAIGIAVMVLGTYSLIKVFWDPYIAGALGSFAPEGLMRILDKVF